MNVSFDGIGAAAVTFLDGGCGKDAPVKLTDNGTVAPCAAGDRMAGLCIAVDSGCAAVQLWGHITVPYTGAAPAVGFAALCADGSGGLKTGDTGGVYLVTEVDETNHTIGLFL